MKRSPLVKFLTLIVTVLLAAGLSTATHAAQIAAITNTAVQSDVADYGIDFANAIPMPLPTVEQMEAQAAVAEEILAAGEPGFSPGRRGNGALSPQVLVPKAALTTVPDLFEPQEFGTSYHPFTTSRVDINSYPASQSFPFAPAGKLFFKIGTSSYVCSASLVKRGVIVTAAHCVTAFGGAWYGSWVFVPAYRSGVAPFGSWSWARAAVVSTYKAGTDSCSVRGIVCRNDVAVITLAPQSGALPGTQTGWYGYGWNNWGFNSSGQILVSQLGYPVSHDSGLRMQRTDSQGYHNSANSYCTIWGSRQTGGSSGGPEIANLGVAATLSGTGYGYAPNYDIVVGVTSWGYTDVNVKRQGASPFLTENVYNLVAGACAAHPANCQ